MLLNYNDGIFPGGLVLLAVGLLTYTFKFIPKATLAGLIICAMYFMIDVSTYKLLWRARSKFHRSLLLSISFFSFSLSCSYTRSNHQRGINGARRTKGASVSESATHTWDAFAVHLFSKSSRETIMLERALVAFVVKTEQCRPFSLTFVAGFISGSSAAS